MIDEANRLWFDLTYSDKVYYEIAEKCVDGGDAPEQVGRKADHLLEPAR